MNPLKLALTCLVRTLHQQQPLDESLEQSADHPQRGLIREITYGVCRYFPALDTLFRALVTKPLKEKDVDIKLIMLMGLYQLRHMRMPEFVAVNETVKLTTQVKKVWAKGLVNAVLRRYLREKDTIEHSLANEPVFNHAHPQWLLGTFEQAGLDVAAICEQNNQKPPLTLRINVTKTSRDAYLSLLQAQGIEAEALAYCDTAITIKSKIDIPSLPYYLDGYFYVQDVAAQFACALLDLADGQTVLDACSAPGGKLTHLLERGFAYKEVIALDQSATRMERVAANLKRMGQKCELVVGDAQFPEQWWQGRQFDRVLLDAPCSAIGVIRRHPDIKCLRDRQAVTQAVQRQSAILTALWPLLKPGGRLVYATCSILPEENEQQLQRFLKQHSEAQAVPFSLPLGQPVSVGWQLLPGESDGFYYAVLEKSVS